jgi:hypothetical protein
MNIFRLAGVKMKIYLWKAYDSYNIALRFRAGMWWLSTSWFVLSLTRISKLERLRFRRPAVIIPLKTGAP